MVRADCKKGKEEGHHNLSLSHSLSPATHVYNVAYTYCADAVAILANVF